MSPKTKTKHLLKPLAVFAALAVAALTARAAVTVSNVVSAQRPGTKLVDISYDVASDATNVVTVSLMVSNGAASVACTNVSGAIGPSVATGTRKAIVWNAGADWGGNVATGVNFTVTADDGAVVPPANMVLVQGGTLPDIGNGALNVATFCIGKYEVTWAEWLGVRTWAATNGYDIGSAGTAAATNQPANFVSWYDAVKWCNARSEKEGRTPAYMVGGGAIYRSGQSNDVAVNTAATGYRLPTGAEWEFAARGGTQNLGYTYSGGNDVNAVSWYSGNSGGGTHIVGTKAGNELGLYDMSGNAYEWCFDWHPGYAGSRVIRGGCWSNAEYYSRVLNRYPYPPDARDNGIGIRVVLPPGQQ